MRVRRLFCVAASEGNGAFSILQSGNGNFGGNENETAKFFSGTDAETEFLFSGYPFYGLCAWPNAPI
jgi:hypothetical protein